MPRKVRMVQTNCRCVGIDSDLNDVSIPAGSIGYVDYPEDDCNLVGVNLECGVLLLEHISSFNNVYNFDGEIVRNHVHYCCKEPSAPFYTYEGESFDLLCNDMWNYMDAMDNYLYMRQAV